VSVCTFLQHANHLGNSLHCALHGFGVILTSSRNACRESIIPIDTHTLAPTGFLRLVCQIFGNIIDTSQGGIYVGKCDLFGIAPSELAWKLGFESLWSYTLTNVEIQLALVNQTLPRSQARFTTLAKK